MLVVVGILIGFVMSQVLMPYERALIEVDDEDEDSEWKDDGEYEWLK